MPDAPTRAPRRMEKEMAEYLIQDFGERYGRPTLYFTWHAAFPMALTPDLLYRLWINFQLDVQDRPLNVPWVATADLLLSDLVRPVGHEVYEMDGAIRDLLLEELRQHADAAVFPCFGAPRLQELGRFLIEYITPQLKAQNQYLRERAQAQQLTAQVYQNPPQAMKNLADQITASIQQGDFSAQLRLAAIVEMLAASLKEQAGFAELDDFTRQRSDLIYGRTPAPALTSAAPERIVVAGVALPAVNEKLPAPQAPPPTTEKPAPTEEKKPAFTPRPGWTLGIDVSRWEGKINWNEVAADPAGVRFALIKATTGVKQEDSSFAVNWEEAHQAGLICGAYHVYQFSQDPVDQADFLYKIVGSRLTEKDLPIVVDIENEPSGRQVARPAKKKAASQAARRVNDLGLFLKKVEQQTRRKPILYTGASAWKEVMDDSLAFSDYALWVATYQAEQPNLPARNWNGRGWSFWQFSNQGRIRGIGTGKVDLNWFRGAEEELRRAFGAGEESDVPSPAEQVAENFSADSITALRGEINLLRGQTNLIGDYLEVFDLLHKLRYQVYEPLKNEPRDLPTPETELYLQILEETIERFKTIRDQEKLPEQALRWVKDAEKISSELDRIIQQARDKQDMAPAYERTLRRLGQLITTQQAYTDKEISAIAHRLRLSEIVIQIKDLLANLISEAQPIRQNEQVLLDIENQAASLNPLLERFDQWVEIEAEMQRLDSLEPDELVLFWPELQAKFATLAAEPGEAEVEASNTLQALDRALTEKDLPAAQKLYPRLRRAVSTSYYRAHVELKNITLEIRRMLDGILPLQTYDDIAAR